MAELVTGSVDKGAVATPVGPDEAVGADTLKRLVECVKLGERETTSRLLRYGELAFQFIAERVDASEESIRVGVRSRAIKTIERELGPIVGHVDVSRWLRYHSLATQFGADHVSCLSQSALRQLITLQVGGKGEYVVPTDWVDFTRMLLQCAAKNVFHHGAFSGEKAKAEIELEQAARRKGKRPSKAEREAEKAKAEKARKAFVASVAKRAESLGVNLAEEFVSEDDGAADGARHAAPSTPDSLEEWAGSFQWTPEHALALVNGLLKSNLDQSAALATLTARLVELAKKQTGGAARKSA